MFHLPHRHFPHFCYYTYDTTLAASLQARIQTTSAYTYSGWMSVIAAWDVDTFRSGVAFLVKHPPSVRQSGFLIPVAGYHALWNLAQVAVSHSYARAHKLCSWNQHLNTNIDVGLTSNGWISFTELRLTFFTDSRPLFGAAFLPRYAPPAVHFTHWALLALERFPATGGSRTECDPRPAPRRPRAASCPARRDQEDCWVVQFSLLHFFRCWTRYAVLSPYCSASLPHPDPAGSSTVHSEPSGAALYKSCRHPGGGRFLAPDRVDTCMPDIAISGQHDKLDVLTVIRAGYHHAPNIRYSFLWPPVGPCPPVRLPRLAAHFAIDFLAAKLRRRAQNGTSGGTNSICTSSFETGFSTKINLAKGAI